MQPLLQKAFVVVAVVLGTAAIARAQATTGSIAGRAQSADGLPLPGVTATITSPMLQGVRTIVTSESGDYLILLLPPGTYTLVFELDGFESVRKVEQTAGGYNATVNVTMSPT